LGVAIVHAVFFAPTVVSLGHSVLTVPVFAGALVNWLVGEPAQAWWLAASAAAVFGGSLVYQYARYGRQPQEPI
jgi:hypothetical protein